MLSAVEFFSGIGAFAQAARQCGVEVVAAFDQSQDANAVYELNHGLRPNSRNLDSIEAKEIPEADLWWLSPPCKPYTIRGKQRDAADARAASMLRLISLLEEKRPKYLMLENVQPFKDSQVHKRLSLQLSELGYRTHELAICSTEFGTPMKRPRFFVVASSGDAPRATSPPVGQPVALSAFLNDDDAEQLIVDAALVNKYEQALNIIDPSDPTSKAICFTSGYGTSLRAAGSFLFRADGSVRRFSPQEIVHLLGFESLRWPPLLPLQSRWRLAGNSVDVRVIRFLLTHYLPLEREPAVSDLIGPGR